MAGYLYSFTLLVLGEGFWLWNHYLSYLFSQDFILIFLLIGMPYKVVILLNNFIVNLKKCILCHQGFQLILAYS